MSHIIHFLLNIGTLHKTTVFFKEQIKFRAEVCWCYRKKRLAEATVASRGRLGSQGRRLRRWRCRRGCRRGRWFFSWLPGSPGRPRRRPRRRRRPWPFSVLNNVRAHQAGLGAVYEDAGRRSGRPQPCLRPQNVPEVTSTACVCVWHRVNGMAKF